MHSDDDNAAAQQGTGLTLGRTADSPSNLPTGPKQCPISLDLRPSGRPFFLRILFLVGCECARPSCSLLRHTLWILSLSYLVVGTDHAVVGIHGRFTLDSARTTLQNVPNVCHLQTTKRHPGSPHRGRD
jgi:hypothetical protein